MENFTHPYTSLLLDFIFTLPRSEYLQFNSTESSRSFTSTVFGRNGSENSLTSLNGNRTRVFRDRVSEMIVNISTPMSTSQDVTTQQIIGDDVRDVIIIVNMAVLCQIVSVAGVIVNVFNVCVFVKQGFRDALNVTLASLALADLGIVSFAVWLCVCYNPLFSKLDLPFKPMEFVYLTAGLPRLSCARVSSWILAIASLERCLCITMPLTFRSIITPRRSFAFAVLVYAVMAASVLPVYYTSRLVWSFDSARNTTMVSLVFTNDRFAVDNVAFMVGVFLSVASFAIVAVCTTILIWSLRKKTKWREQAIAKVGSDSKFPLVSSRNKRVGKMVSVISIFFIVCYTPNTVNQLVMSLVQDFAKNGSQVNANQVSWSFGFLLESVYSLVTIIIYYKMSSRFRDTVISMFQRNRGSDHMNSTSSYSSNGNQQWQ
ncbi:uncharacterized protein LOC106062364 [Biomphalaria glabrata]|uniref:Uncharacterized protein LOC106062364 n=1 Tax=Biomphalaria glabrata TaxID=6526 RepID=A0A9U8E799_BIOGL|nr:uncharacterized protein LOC106062364 [Biomphalaria glabrata]